MAGEQRKKGKRTRLDDIAARCGVSVSTVSRALGGRKRRPAGNPQAGDRDRERCKLRSARQRCGQQSVLVASSAAMIDYVRNQFTWHVLEGLNARADALGIEIVMCPVADTADELRVVEDVRHDPAIGGMLVLTVDDEDLLAAAAGLGKPVVMINGDDPYMRFSSVTPCNRSAAFIATQQLVAAGHERILFMMRPGRRTIERRMEGWRDALWRHGLYAEAHSHRGRRLAAGPCGRRRSPAM